VRFVRFRKNRGRGIRCRDNVIVQPRSRHSVRLVGSATALLLAVPLTTGCGSLLFDEGDQLAHRGAENVVAQIASHSDNTAEVTIEEMVAWWVPEGQVAAKPGLATIDALAWSGQIGHESTATIDVRIHVEVKARSSTAIGGRSNSAGEATVCSRLIWSRYEEAQRSEIPCPDTAAPPRPEPTARPELTEEDTARVAHILATTGELEAIDTALRDSFPEEYYRVDTELWNGETVVAVGIPAERECILIVRNLAGELSYPSYRRISLEPGETGCSTNLFTHPPFSGEAGVGAETRTWNTKTRTDDSAAPCSAGDVINLVQ